MNSLLFKLINYIDIENKICAEIGVQRGEFSKSILSYKPKELYLIDCWAHQDSKIYKDGANISQDLQENLYLEVVKKFQYNENVKIIRSFSNEACLIFSNSYFDFIYIDANHSLEACYSDIKLWFPKLKINGTIAGHDYHNGRHPGVTKAVQLFATENNLNVDELSRGSWGIIKTKEQS